MRCRRVARIWKRGGLFWKSEKCANDLDSNFHRPWISFRRSVRNLRRNVSEKSEIQRFFPPKIRWSPKQNKKKKGLRQNSEWFFGRNPKFQRFFRPKLGDLQKKKKKKGLRQNSGRFFSQFRKFKRLRGALFVWGGLFSIFHRKSASKAQKSCDFAYFTSQWVGLEPPPLATLLMRCKVVIRTLVRGPGERSLSECDKLLQKVNTRLKWFPYATAN